MSTRVPKYRLHKASGKALVEIQGRRVYLGKHGSESSKDRYRQLVAELFGASTTLFAPRQTGTALTIAELILCYFQHAKSYYRRDGKPTGEADNIRYAGVA